MSDEQQPEPGLYIPPSQTWPGDLNIEGLITLPEQTLEATPLSPEQDARVSALYHARSALESRGGPFGSGDGSRPPKVDDLIAAARWIMNGDDGEHDH